MKWNLKRVKNKIEALVGICLTMSLVGCMPEFDASSYVNGILNNIYLGDSAVYRELVEVSEEEAHEAYLKGMEAEADFLVQYYKIDGGVSEEIHEEIVKLYQEIYGYSRFEVSKAVRVGDDYQVDVKVSPIDVIINSESDILKAVDEFSENIDFTDITDYEDVQILNDAVARIVVDVIRENLPELGYLEDVTVTVMVKKDAEGYYEIDRDAIMQIDSEIIGY